MAQVSIVILTLNEERNIAACIASVRGWADEVFVFDSLSGDQTAPIAESLGARIYRRRFDNFSRHKNWALDHLPLRNEWVFLLDADERVTPALRDEITATAASPERALDGYYVARRNYFMGRWIRHADMYPNWNMRFFKHRLGRFEDRIVHEHVILNGRAGYLVNPLEHDDYKGLERYFDRHNTYSSMEALEAWRVGREGNAARIDKRLFARGPARRRLMKEFAYRYLPCRALLRFVWMYFIRAGFLDGRIGFRYCALAGFYEYQVSLKRLELESDPSSPMFARYAGASAADTSDDVPERASDCATGAAAH